MTTPFLQATAKDPLLTTIRQAGIVAQMMQHRISDEGKVDETSFPNDDDALRARRAAKTAIDEVVQELLLDTVRTVVDPSETSLDAEEDTPMVEYFQRRGAASQTVIIDPIDGTYEYLKGRQTYSICTGLWRNKKIVSCAVYFPAQQAAYLLLEDGQPMLHDAATGLFEPLNSPENPSKIVYKNGRVPHVVVKRLENAGFAVKDDTEVPGSASGALLACLDGTAAGYICHTRNVRDIFLGAIIASLPMGFALDWQGGKFQWPAGGRIDRAVFGATTVFKNEIVACLRG